MAARSRKSCEATLARADGVVWLRNSLTTPPRPLHQGKLRDISLDVASTPPGQEGQWVVFEIASELDPLLLSGANADVFIRISMQSTGSPVPRSTRALHWRSLTHPPAVR